MRPSPCNHTLTKSSPNRVGKCCQYLLCDLTACLARISTQPGQRSVTRAVTERLYR